MYIVKKYKSMHLMDSIWMDKREKVKTSSLIYTKWKHLEY